jgi:hypothetical protein
VSEREVTEDQVRREHKESVNVPAHWAYFATVLLGSAVLMLAFVALLGAAHSG